MIKITEKNDRIYIEAPYNPEFITRIKTAGGRWSKESKAWSLDARAIEVAREILRDVYGQDDKPARLVTVTVTLTKMLQGDKAPVYLLGKMIASAYGRDSGAKVADGVVFKIGNPRSGGSRANWVTVVDSGSVFEIYDVPETMLETWSEELGTAKITTTQDPKTALLEEKERLLARLAEIVKK